MSLIFEHLLEDEEPESTPPVPPESNTADQDEEQPADEPSAENGFVGKWI